MTKSRQEENLCRTLLGSFQTGIVDATDGSDLSQASIERENKKS